ncbi:TonB-dependent receptor plug domain-containing protein [bacterium]|nr:TonB-dependent receptor plug domain-containing protein [bacterium]
MKTRGLWLGLWAAIIWPGLVSAQQSRITGLVFNALNKEPLEKASVSVQGTGKGATTDSLGYFVVDGIAPGLYNLEVRFTGFETSIEYEIRTSSVKPVYIEIGLIPSTFSLGEVVVSDEARTHTVVTPLSVQKIGWAELQRMPGATLDISKAIQSYPGVLPKSSFGYNIVVRGGAPNENAYYLDGIKIPAINHFSVQGASGGPNGLVNLDFIQDMELYSGAFPANYLSGLSSLMDLRQRDGRSDRIGSRITLGYSDLGCTIEGPLSKKSNFIMSARTSFSQYLLKALNVPVLPKYKDFQFRNKWRFDDKNELIITGLAGFDVFKLNTTAPESDALLYNVGYIPEGTQNQYAVGANYKHYLKNSFYTLVVSRNGFDNRADKFRNNSYQEADRLLKYRSAEAENHIRFEHNIYQGNTEFKYGITYVHNQSKINVAGYDVGGAGVEHVDFSNQMQYNQYGAFALVSKRLMDSKLGITAGLRSDGSNVAKSMRNPLGQISPRLSANYALTEFLSLKSTAGIYYQMPPQIILAYNAANVDQGLSDYMKAKQASVGFEYRNKKTYRASVDLYYKGYSQYPFLLRDSISFANAMADYVVVGNQPSVANSTGRSYGAELFIQQKLKRNYWWMLAYSYNKCEFKDKKGVFRPSSWESLHFITLNVGKTFKRNWQLGIKWRYSNGTPYTPYNVSKSSVIDNWNVTNKGVFDYNQLNAKRLPSFHQMDIRVDKNWWFGKWNLNMFFDLQNAYGSNIQLMPYLTTSRDSNWNPIVDPANPGHYLLKQINSDTGRTLYTLGLIAEF